MRSGKLHSYADMLQTALVDEAKLDNRILSYFGLFRLDERAADIRMYDQYAIAVHYFLSSEDQGCGAKGPFAQLAKGRGGFYYSLAASLLSSSPG